jgi:flagellar protein FlaJ
MSNHSPDQSDTVDAAATESYHSPSAKEQLIDAVAALFEFTDNDDTGPTRLDKTAYRMFGSRIREREERFESYRETVNAARLEKTYDEYLAKTALLTLLMGGVGMLLGVFIGGFLSYANVFGAIQPDVALPSFLANALTETTKNFLGAVSLTVVSALIFGGITFAILYFAPYNRAYERSREIENLLPQTVTYMYALSQGGMLLVDIIERLADEKGTYGEMAVEFQAVRNNMEFFGSDLKTALRETRNATPNDELGELLDDLVSIIDSGGNPTPFLEDKTEEFHRKSKRNEESFLETLDLVAQAYVTIGVVGVLLALTVFIIIGSIGGSGSGPIYGTVYFGIPILGLLFYVVLDSITVSDKATTATLPEQISELTAKDIEQRLNAPNEAHSSLTTDGGQNVSRTTTPSRPTYSRTDGHSGPIDTGEEKILGQLHNALRRERVLETLGAPLRLIKRRPLTSVMFSVPAALIYIALVSFTGLVEFSSEAMLSRPVWVTTVGIVIPFIGILSPISYFHERNARYQRQINKELADVLQKLSSASGTGAKLSDNIKLVANSSTGILATELRRVENELYWNVSMNNALTRFANRVRNPRLTRVIKLLIESNTASGRVSDVLSVAAKDAQTAKELDARRLSSMTTNMVIIVFGYLIFLAVSVILITQLFPPLAEAASVSSGVDSQAASGTIGGGWDFDLDESRMLFFHGILVQGLVSGTMAGKFGYDSALSGLKFTIIGMLLAVAVFFLI